MDVIGDTDMAVAAYQCLEPVPGTGGLYLIAYGLLQALFVQQDAVRHVAEAVGFDYTLPSPLRLIREIRNCAIGHPTKRYGADAKSFGIIRISLDQKRFTLYSFESDGTLPRQEVDLTKLVDLQISHVCIALDAITSHLKDRFDCP
jgi:hypothetical protein